jgi:hypothetical protein
MTGAQLQNLATVIRSKNAGPHVLCVDILFGDPLNYRRVKQSGVINCDVVSELFRVPPEQILRILYYDAARGIKISMRRDPPAGSPGDSDVYGCQQFIPCLALEIP